MMRSPQPPAIPRNVRGGAALAVLAALVLSGCNLAYYEGRQREAQKRWEEAAIQYHLAHISNPKDPEYKEAFLRASKQVARENMTRYRQYVANKEFAKAYPRLVDATRQDPDLADAKEESAKWMRVLIGGQVHLDFHSPQGVSSLADEIRLAIRVNTPNPGEVVEAEIDVDTGVFFVEALLYDRPDVLLTYFSVNSIGLSLVQGKSRIKQFSNREFVRFVNFRTPVLDSPPESVTFGSDDTLATVAERRPAAASEPEEAPLWFPRVNPRYRMIVQGGRILVNSSDSRSDFTPRFLYINKKDRRLFVDFGRYEVKQNDSGNQWGLRRLPVQPKDYIGLLTKNVALQPYFYFRGTVLAYLPAKAG